jgi:hypothetical protein
MVVTVEVVVVVGGGEGKEEEGHINLLKNISCYYLASCFPLLFNV